MARLTALLDANVLYTAGLRDVFLRLADRYLYVPLWSADIHAEWVRSLLADRPDIDACVLDRTRAVMDGHFPDAVVTGYEAIAARLDLPDPGDRHVLAAAIRGQADVIVTGNLRDFPPDRLAPYALVAQHPDTFVADLFEADPDAVLAAVLRPPGGATQSAAFGERSSGRVRTSRPGPHSVAAAAARSRNLTAVAPVERAACQGGCRPRLCGWRDCPTCRQEAA